MTQITRLSALSNKIVCKFNNWQKECACGRRKALCSRFVGRWKSRTKQIIMHKNQANLLTDKSTGEMINISQAIRYLPIVRTVQIGVTT